MNAQPPCRRSAAGDESLRVVPRGLFLIGMATALSTMWAAEARAAPPATPEAPSLSAFSTAGGAEPRLERVDLDGQRVLRLRTEAAYGTLVHPLPPAIPAAGATLRWRWRLDQPVAGADLRTRAGDDSALKLCLMFDLPLERLGLWERNLMRLARATSSEPLPAATLCYVWDPSLPAGTLLPNAYSPRVRFLVLDGQGAPLGSWRSHERPIAADFLRAFGHESPTVPPLVAVVAGTDSDNTGGGGLSYLGDVQLGP
jgi:Protein of unknown function (DUF3047)